MKNQKTIVRILALFMAALLALSLIVSVIPIRSHADIWTDDRTQNQISFTTEVLTEDQ